MSHAISKYPQQFSDDVGKTKWEVSMVENYSSLMKIHTCDFVPLPKGCKLIHWKWVYKNKYVADGYVHKHKACLVAKGFSQVEGTIYFETFALVAKMDSIRLVLSFATSQDWSVYQMDVKSAFTYGDIHEEIYMEQPLSFM